MIYRANILVVDDDVAVGKSIAGVLGKEGYTVDIAGSGEVALEKVRKNKYAIALVDLMMPGMNGIDVLKEIKQENPNITIIMITGYPSVKTAVESIKLSAFDYIPKPFTPDELRNLVARALERRLAYEEIASKTGIIEESLVGISIPRGIYCIPGNSWVRPETGGVRVGMHHELSRSIKGIFSIEFPAKNEIKYQGEILLKILDFQKQPFRLWTPVSGKILQLHEELSADYSKLIHDPYNEGWLVIMEPTQWEEEVKNLTYIGPGNPEES